MSVTTLIGRIGDPITVYRPTTGENADGSLAVTGWTLISTGTKASLQVVTDEYRAKVFGMQSQASYRGYVAGAPDIQKGDGVLVAAGDLNGSRWMVEERLAHDFKSPNKHIVLGLAKTDLVFP